MPPDPPPTKRYPTYNYNFRKRPAEASSKADPVSFNDIASSEDEINPVIAKKVHRRRIKTPSTSSNDSSASSGDETDDDNDEFAEYINCHELPPASSSKKQISSSLFRLMKHNHLGKVCIKLFIFKPGRTPLCNEFTWQKKDKCFQCLDCSIKADVYKNEKGKTYVRLSAASHPCEPRIYNPEKFQHKIIKRPNFDIVEFQHNGVTKKKLFIFDEKNSEMGYEYSWDKANSDFRCGPCASRRCVRAKLFKDESGEECIQLGNIEHVCTQRLLNIGYLSQEKRTISESHFAVITNGQKRTLIVYDSEDRTKCYKYYWAPSAGVFICNGCRSRDFYVHARFKPNSDEKIIILSDTNHVCPLLDSDSIKDEAAANVEEITSGFEYLTFEKKPPKIVLFLDAEKKKCHEFAAVRHHGQYSDKFLCIGCNNSPVRPRIIAKLILSKNASGQQCLKMLQSQHTCEPRKYESKKFEKTIVKFPNFLFCQYKDESSTKLILFHPLGQRKRCYMYGQNRDFQCVQCRKRKKFLTVKVFQNRENGEEEVVIKAFDHACEPLEWDEISGDCRILHDSGLFKRKKIIENGQYEFRKNDSRCENSYLLIFDQNDKNLCYEFRRDPRTRIYYCIKCKEMNRQINAKFCESDNNIELEGDAHLCTPEPYTPLKNIVEASSYKIFKGKNDNDQLAIFTSPDKTTGYKYGYLKDKKIFVCYACRGQRPFVSAKVCQRLNGEEYVQLSQNKHVCKPKKLNFD